MKINFQKHTDPWLHYTLPNFLPDPIFNVVEKTANKFLDIETENIKSIKNVNHASENFRNWFIEKYPIFCNLLEVKEIQPVDVAFQYSCYNNCDDSQRYDGGIHTDSFDKQLSCLIPISEKGSGTMLYNENKSFVKQIEWKKNTAFLFANKPTFWHAVGKANGTSRCLLNVIYYPKGYARIHENLYNVKRSREHHLVKSK